MKVREEISVVQNIYFPVPNQFFKQILEKANVHILLLSSVLNAIHVQCFRIILGIKATVE